MLFFLTKEHFARDNHPLENTLMLFSALGENGFVWQKSRFSFTPGRRPQRTKARDQLAPPGLLHEFKLGHHRVRSFGVTESRTLPNGSGGSGRSISVVGKGRSRGALRRTQVAGCRLCIAGNVYLPMELASKNNNARSMTYVALKISLAALKSG